MNCVIKHPKYYIVTDSKFKTSGYISIWKKTINNKIIFGCIIFALVSLYTVNNTVSIEYFSEYISLPIYTVIPGVLIILSIWALSRSDNVSRLS